nr:hypothetical protein [Candidatus Sigynarchaeota archaeon]
MMAGIGNMKDAGMSKVDPHVETLSLYLKDIRDLTFLPPELPNLQELSIYQCGLRSLEGLPDELPTLEIMSVCLNSLCDLKHFPASIPNLKQLYLDANGITSIHGLPSELPKLNVLSLKMNNLETFPSPFSGIKMPDLKILDISKNAFKSLKKMPGNMPSLETFCAVSNQLTDLRGFPSDTSRIKLFDVSCNQINELDGFPRSAPSLETLDLSGNQIGSGHLDFLPRRMDSLISMRMSKNVIKEGSGLPTHLPALQHLDLSYNGLESFTGFPKELPSLTSMDLQGNRLANFEGFPDCPQLGKMDVRGNRALSSFHGLKRGVMVKIALDMVTDVYGYNFSPDIIYDLRQLQVSLKNDGPAWDKLVNYYKESISSIINRMIEAKSVEGLEKWEYNRVVHEGTEKDLHRIEVSADFLGKDALVKQLESAIKKHRSL